MTNFGDAWFLLKHSAYPVTCGVLFFLLGLWFAYLLWHRWVRHLHVLRREHRELETTVKLLQEERSAGGGHAPAEVERRVRVLFGLEQRRPGLEQRRAFPDTRTQPVLRESPASGIRNPGVQSLIAVAAKAFAARREALDGKA